MDHTSGGADYFQEKERLEQHHEEVHLDNSEANNTTIENFRKNLRLFLRATYITR